MTTVSNASTLAVENANFRHLVADIAWFGLALTSTARFLSVFALRLGASEADLGWMTSLPALLLAFSTTFALAWRARRRNTIDALALPGFVFRLTFLLPALTPLMPPKWQIPWLILSASIPALGQGIASVLFFTGIQESVSQPRTTDLFSKRSLTFNIALALSAVVFGVLLQRVPFPTNYQLMFVASFGFALLSLWHCTRIDPIFGSNAPHYAKHAILAAWRAREFRSLVLTMVVTFGAFYSVYALVNYRLVQQLGADESYMAVYALIEMAAGALISHFATRIVTRMGHRGAMAAAMILTALPLVMLAVTSSLWVASIAAIISGAAWTFVAMVGIVGLYVQAVPLAEATAYGVAYHQVYGLAIFAAPFIGTLLITSGISIENALVTGAALRVLAGIAIGVSWWRHSHSHVPLPYSA
ncbi:MAG: MFS transporter [Anaerolineae bacterium]|nr:MFS transporter [Anaerolineae bacterium]